MNNDKFYWESSSNTNSLNFSSIFKPDYSIKFMRETKEVGIFDFNNSPATFVGDVDESAKIFCETILKMMPEMAKKLCESK